MSVSNEVVKFIAEIELDAQDKAAFTKALKDANDECATFRKEIARTETEMAKLAAAGKKDSDEFKKLGEQLNQTKDKLKASSKEANKYASALGVNQMTYNQLKAHASRLRKELNSLHKESDPRVWEKYNRELVATEKRMKEVQGGMKQSKGVLENIPSVVKKIGVGFSVASAVIGGAKKIFEEFGAASQTWGDRIGVWQAQFSQAWQHIVAQISNGNKVSIDSIKDVMTAAKEAQQLRDGLFEKENALKIEEAKAQAYIAKQEQIVNDSTKSAEERLQAQEKILDKEKELAEYRKNIATDSLDAALLDLKRTGLNQAQIEKLVDGYLKNEELFNDAKASMAEYNKKKEELENQLAEAVKTGDYNLKAELNMQLKELWEEYEDAYHIDNLIKKYDLGNDALVKAYVDARVQMEQADAQVEQAKATRMRKTSQFVKQLQDEEAQRQEQVFNDKVKEADDAYSKELTDLKNSLAKKEITEEEFHEKSLAAEGAYLLKKKAILQAYGKDTVGIEGQIADWRLEAGTPEESPNRPTTDLSVSRDLTAKLPGKATTSEKSPGLAQTFETEMTALNILHESKMISEEEFLKAKSALLKKYNKEDVETEQTLWEQGTQGKLQATQMMLDAMGQAVSSAKDAELATLEAQMQAELAAAGDNADKRAEIEAKYEAKKLDVQKKYADVELGINIAQALAQGALAVIQTWAQLGPIAGSIMAAVVAATTAAQIAVMVQQRNAIKNSTVSSAPSSSSSTTSMSTPSISPSTPSTPDTPAGTTYIRKLNGYSEGGYTGSGGRLEVAGVVHRGEYVVPQPEMRDPAVLAMVASIENRRRRRTSANALPGFAEGGYTGANNTEQILTDILLAIKSNNDNPVPAYVVLSEYEAKKDLCERIRRAATLRVIP